MLKRKIKKILGSMLCIVMIATSMVPVYADTYRYSSDGKLKIKYGDNDVFYFNTDELKSLYNASKQVDADMNALISDGKSNKTALVKAINSKSESQSGGAALVTTDDSFDKIVLAASYCTLKYALFNYDDKYYRISGYSFSSDPYTYDNSNNITGYTVLVTASPATNQITNQNYSIPIIDTTQKKYDSIDINSYGIYQLDRNGGGTLYTDKSHMELYLDAADLITLSNNLEIVQNAYSKCNKIYNTHKLNLINCLDSRGIDMSKWNGKNIYDISFSKIISEISNISTGESNTSNILDVNDGHYRIEKQSDNTFKISYQF